MESGKLGYGVRVLRVPGSGADRDGQSAGYDCATIGLFPSAADAAMAVAP